MALPTSRVKDSAEITIIPSLCNGCGKCITVCKGFNLKLENNLVEVISSSMFGCVGCGHCMAICPTGAIEINKRETSPKDLFRIPPKEDMADYHQLLSLFQHRRSIREFENREVESDKIDQIISAAKTAPMGIPPSDVHLLVLNGRDKTEQFAKDFSEYLKGIKFITSKFVLGLLRLLSSKETTEMLNEFMKPLYTAYTDEMDKGNNLINYSAPLAIYFYGTPYSDPADPIIAATYAMIAGESLGLGSCMIGGIHPFIQVGKKAKKFREDHKIKYKSREGLFVIFGYPSVKYRYGIKRTFASIIET